MHSQTIGEHVANKDFKNSLAYFSKTKTYSLNGVMLSEKRINELYPTNLPLISANCRKIKGDNPDKTKV